MVSCSSTIIKSLTMRQSQKWLKHVEQQNPTDGLKEEKATPRPYQDYSTHEYGIPPTRSGA